MSELSFLDFLKELNGGLGDPTGINGFISSAMRTIAVFTFFIAVVQCFLGYKLFKFWVSVCGFFAFGILGGAISGAITKEAGITVFFAIICAILGAFVAYKLYVAGVFILCGFMGFILGYLLTQSPGLGIVMALVLGILGAIFVKPVIIISTSVTNGLLAGSALAIIFGAKNSTIGIILGIIFAISGILVQFATNKGDKRIAPIHADAHHSDHAFTFIKDSAVQASNSVSIKVKNKIEQDHLVVKNRAKGVTFEEVCENLEEVFYSNRIIKNIMPFAEYILAALVFLTIVSSFSSLVLLLFIGVLCFAKKKYGVLSIAFFIVTLSKVMMIIRLLFSHYYEYVAFSTVLSALIETALMGCVTLVATTYYLDSKHGAPLKNKLSNLLTILKAKAISSRKN